MKKLAFLFNTLGALALFVILAACSSSSESSSNGNADSDGSSASIMSAPTAADNSPITVKVKGDINVNLDKAQLVGKEGSVSFNHFPNTLSQFEDVLPTLKQTPQGAVAAMLMAMELYRRNRTDGEKAIKMCNVTSNVSMVMERLPDLFGFAGNSYGGDSNSRPYQVASLLQGATPENGYTPSQPYTVNVKVGVNCKVYSNIYQTDVLYLQVETKGTDSGYRACEVINTKKPGEPTGWIIFNCPGLYVRCKEVSFDSPFKGLE